MVSCILFSALFKMNEKGTEVKSVAPTSEYRVPLILILLISIILSLYSAYLATTGKLVDTVRYAWSFLYRYPSFYSSFESLLESQTEIGFLLINKLILEYTTNPYWLFLFIALFTTTINLYVSSRWSKNFLTIVLLYLVSLYFFQTTYLLRQALAVSFANLAIFALIRESKMKFWIYSVVAVLFHITALILIPIYFILTFFKRRNSYMIGTIAIILFLFLIEVLSNRVGLKLIDQYLAYDEISLALGGGSISSVLKGLPFYFITVLALIKRKELQKVLYKSDFYIISSVIYSCSWLMTYNMYWSFRMGWYFMLPVLVMVPSLMSLVSNRREKTLYNFIFVGLLILITFRQILITLQ